MNPASKPLYTKTGQGHGGWRIWFGSRLIGNALEEEMADTIVSLLNQMGEDDDDLPSAEVLKNAAAKAKARANAIADRFVEAGIEVPVAGIDGTLQEHWLYTHQLLRMASREAFVAQLMQRSTKQLLSLEGPSLAMNE